MEKTSLSFPLLLLLLLLLCNRNIIYRKRKRKNYSVQAIFLQHRSAVMDGNSSCRNSVSEERACCFLLYRFV
jgi:hypothetical protein